MYDTVELALANGKLVWECEYDDSARLYVKDSNGKVLAMETAESGVHCGIAGALFRVEPVFDERGTLEHDETHFVWERCFPDKGLAVKQMWRVLDATGIECRTRLTALARLERPCLDWGFEVLAGLNFSRFAFAQSMTQMGYSFKKENLTLWVLGTPPAKNSGAAFAGCQGLVAENPDPGKLEFHLRMPPGFVAPPQKPYALEAGEYLEMSSVVRLAPGAFYEHAADNERFTTRTFFPPRYAYQKYIELSLENFLDKRKYYPCGRGILYHTAVDGAAENPRVQYWTEGPSWGGACDAENTWNMLLLAKAMPERAAELTNHARKMFLGWVDNPRFRVPQGVYEKTPGDLDAAYVTTGWFPDCIWTIAQADLLLRLADIHRLTGWGEALPEARKLAKFLAGRISGAGEIPTVWQFPVEYPPELGQGWRPNFSRLTRHDRLAEVLIGSQPVSACFLATAFRHLADADTENALLWNDAASRLMTNAIPKLREPLCNFGNGECDYSVYRSLSIDPTGIAYILRGLSEDFERTHNMEIPPLVRRYMDVMSSFAVHWDADETRMRPAEKRSLGAYEADIRLAGGVTHGNWMPVYKRGFGGRFNLLMNRNEIADGMYFAWRVTHDGRDLEHLKGFANFQTYFQFLGEVADSPVTTKGSCPQNHFWTTDQGNWNNDFALTAFKWTGTYRMLIEAGIC